MAKLLKRMIMKVITECRDTLVHLVFNREYAKRNERVIGYGRQFHSLTHSLTRCTIFYKIKKKNRQAGRLSFTFTSGINVFLAVCIFCKLIQLNSH